MCAENAHIWFSVDLLSPADPPACGRVGPDLKDAALACLRELMRPVVRLMVKSGVSWREFSRATKVSFVEVATDEFGIRGRPTNVARVSILTGIHRREVARLREVLDAEAAAPPTYLNAAQRVLSAWHQLPGYLEADGQPQVVAVDGPAPSFAQLCAGHAGDVPATALLKELRMVGCVGTTSDGRLQALSRVYIPLRVDPAKVRRAGSVLADLGETVVHDLICGSADALRFERRAENDRIDPRHLEAFRSMLEREGQQFLERVDDWLTQHERKAGDPATTTPLRLGAGLYHIQRNERPRPGERRSTTGVIP
jgi:hypothetical protein